jgi:peptidoglycan lytic transglycosylase G
MTARRWAALFTLVLLAGALAIGLAARVMYSRVHAPFRAFEAPEQFVEIPQGAGSRVIGDRLVAAGVVQDRWTFRLALWLSGEGRRLQAGEYRFDRPATPLEIVDRIARGDVFVIRVTFPEGLTIPDMAAIFESHGFGRAPLFLDAAKDTAAIRDLDPAAADLEGYLFPDTYPLPRHTDAAKLVRQMTAEFARALTPELRAAAAARHLSVRETVTLASIVEKETARPEERPLVAAVYENRLRLGMPLQCDPTVIYALQRAGKYDGNLTRQSLAYDSPYNTYKYPGLPPGPIASPGRASIEAAVHPADDPGVLYFVSRNDGSHEFARTLEEHNRNVRKYQVEYFRAGRDARAGTDGQAVGTPGRGQRSGRAKGGRRR